MPIDRAAFRRQVAFGFLLSLLTGCAGKLADKESFLAAAAFEDGGVPSLDACGDVPARIFVKSCGDTGCHGATGAQQGLDLVSPGVAARVVGVSGKACPTLLADPTDPQGSLLYQKLAPKPACGFQMPLARPALSSADTACVAAWIAAQ